MGKNKGPGAREGGGAKKQNGRAEAAATLAASATAKGAKGSGSSSTKQDRAELVNFPRIGYENGSKPSSRKLGEASVLETDQILMYSNTLTDKECDALVAMFDPGRGAGDALAMQPSPPARKGEAERTNSRFSTVSPVFAAQLYEATGIKQAVAAWPSMFPQSASVPKALSSNIRIYRYDPGDIFACHYDDHSTDPHYGPTFGRTEWTLLIYLTGEPDIQGGQTVFYKSHTRPKAGINATDKAVVAPLQKGAALFHRHGKVCMLHEALPPTKGTKWVLRSDLIFGPPS